MSTLAGYLRRVRLLDPCTGEGGRAMASSMALGELFRATVDAQVDSLVEAVRGNDIDELELFVRKVLATYPVERLCTIHDELHAELPEAWAGMGEEDDEAP